MLCWSLLQPPGPAGREVTKAQGEKVGSQATENSEQQPDGWAKPGGGIMWTHTGQSGSGQDGKAQEEPTLSLQI